MTKWGMLKWFKHTSDFLCLYSSLTVDTEDVPVLPALTAFTASIRQNEIPKMWHDGSSENVYCCKPTCVVIYWPRQDGTIPERIHLMDQRTGRVVGPERD